jgi:isoquinoline 1-oxidoreductase
MKDRLDSEFVAEIDPQEYATTPLLHQFEIARRDFFKALGGGLCVALLLKDANAQGNRSRLPQEIGAWLHVAEDGAITVFTGKVEVGQNIRTSLTQVVAEELHAPVTAIRLVMGDTDLTPFDQGTFGSRTTPDMVPQLRKVAAATREALLDLAAEHWKAERASLVVAEAKITNPASRQSLSFGQLTKGQKLLKAVSSDVPTTPVKDWKIAGQSAPKVNGRDFVTGKHQYTSDLTRPGMLYGKVLRPPTLGATLVSLRSDEAERMPGVTVVRDGDFAGVTAPSEHAAERAIAALQAEWKASPQHTAVSSRALFEHVRKNNASTQPEGRTAPQPFTVGRIEDGLAAADKKLTQSYNVHYIAHTPLEPRAAVAEWNDGKLTVWTGTQRPFGVRGELMQTFHLSEDRVRVIMPDTGSGYGGKHTGEYAIEAARLAKAAGRPVRLVWTREEEFTFAYFRPGGVIEITGGVNKNGGLTAWHFNSLNAGPAGVRTPYDAPHQRIVFTPSNLPLRTGPYRALAATTNNFARETLMDELALAAGIDPLEFRLRNLAATKPEAMRLRAVLEAAAKAFGWGKTKAAADCGFGLACGTEKGGYVATCAEVSVERGQVKIVRATTAFECGAIINPDNLKNQIEGCVIQAIGGALFEKIEFEQGRILNAALSRYRVPRFSDVPKLETIMLNRPDLVSAGAGEAPFLALAPAVGNALFAATGQRLRRMPLAPDSGRL